MSNPSGGMARYTSMKPVFIDQVAVDVVVYEHRWMKLTSAEKRHAVHRLLEQRGMTPTRVADLMRMSGSTVQRILENPPPPILDVDPDTGELVEAVSIGM